MMVDAQMVEYPNSLSSVLQSSSIKQEFPQQDEQPSSLSAALRSLIPGSTPPPTAPQNPGSLIPGSPLAALACPQCPKTFETPSKLASHQQMFHTDKGALLQPLPTPSPSMASNQSTGPHEKSFVCEICGKAFRFRSNLAEHRSVHTALKPYVCKYCGKSSRLKGNLTKHILKHHKREQAEQVSKDDIIVRKEPSANDLLLEKSMLVLQSQSPLNAVSNQLSDFVSLLPKEEKSDPEYERAFFLSFGLDQGSMDLTGGSPDGSSDNGTDPTGGSHNDFDSEISGSPLPTSTIGGASSLHALLAQVASTPSTPPPASVTPVLPQTLPPTFSLPSNGLHHAAVSNHTTSHTNTPSKTQCAECGKHFRKVSALQLHMTLNHGCAPPASSIDSACDEKMIIDEPETSNSDVMGLHNDLRHMQNVITERFMGLEQIMKGFDQRMCKMEKNVETVMNSMYSLVQLQTGLSTNLNRLREDVRHAAPPMPDV